jgi:hypothetical protein
MTYKTFPTELIPASNSVMLTSPTFGFTSAFTGVEQNVVHPGSRWTIEMTFPTLHGRQKRILQAFLNGLHGKAEAIKVYDHSRDGRPAMGSPAVSGDGQTGKRLLTSGWIPNQKVLEIGDLVTVNNELKEVSEDAWSDQNGFCTVAFNPPLRKQPPNGASIETQHPYMIATMDADGIAIENRAMGFAEFETIVFKEAIYR